MVTLELERIEALGLLAMTLAHLNDAESRGEVSPRVPPLMAIQDTLANALSGLDRKTVTAIVGGAAVRAPG